jgi:hypothetical protein
MDGGSVRRRSLGLRRTLALAELCRHKLGDVLARVYISSKPCC